MRLLSWLLAALFLLAGLLFGALNGITVSLDFYWQQFSLPLGVALLSFALLGAVLAGGLLWLSVIWPQRRRIAALLRRELALAAAVSPLPPDDGEGH